MFLYVCLVGLVFIFSTMRWKMRKFRKISRLIKNDYTEFPIVGHAYMFLGNSEDRMAALQTLGRQAIKHGGITKLWLGHRFYLVIADPEMAELVLRTCLEKDDIVNSIKILIGTGSVTAPLPIWRRRRKVLSPIFSTKNLDNVVDILSEQSDLMTQRLQSSAGSEPFSVSTYLSTYAMDSAFETFLGVKTLSKKKDNGLFLKTYESFIQLLTDRGSRFWLHSDFIYNMTPSYRKMKSVVKFIHDYIDPIIRKETSNESNNERVHKNNENKRKDSVLNFKDLKNTSSLKQGFSDEELMEEAMVLLTAGTDTTALGIGFTILMLSRHPDVQEKLYQELKDIFKYTTRPLVAEDLSHLIYLDAVIKETLRLCTIVPIVGRKVVKEFQLTSDISVCEGTGFVVNLWAINRNPRYWGADAELFRPERFLDTAFKHPAQFMPFSYGLRNCIGYRFAMLSLKTAIATLLQSFRILPMANFSTKTDANGSITSVPPLRIKYEILMKNVDNFTVQFESRF